MFYENTKHKTLCWECEWAGGKDKKCPWATNFQPVPGWEAIPSTEDKNPIYDDSFTVRKCPLFEIDHIIKENLCKPRSKKKETKKEIIETIEFLYFDIKLPYNEIAKLVASSEEYVKRICENLTERRIK